MKVEISKLPPEIMERLKKIQQNPKESVDYYEKTGGRGWAIFGIIVVIGTFLVSYAIINDARSVRDLLDWWVWLGIWVIAAWIWTASTNYLKRYKLAELKPCVFLTPLYLVRVTLDHVAFHNLWTERKDLKITHHYYNGAYTHTAFDFKFNDGTNDSLSIKPQARADSVMRVMQSYQDYIAAAVEKQDYLSIAKLDMFIEVKEQAKEQDAGAVKDLLAPELPAKTSGWLTFAKVCLIGSITALLFFCYNSYTIQKKNLTGCHSIQDYEYFLAREYFPKFLETEARDALFRRYKIELDNYKRNAKELRRMIALKRCNSLLPEQEKEILELYRTEGSKALSALYLDIIAKYQKSSTEADPKAREAIVKMLETASGQNAYHVRTTYQSVTEEAEGSLEVTLESGARKTLESMAGAFSPERNRQRESYITSCIQKAFSQIIPSSILEFESMPGEIEFKIAYTVVRSGDYYYSTKTPEPLRKYYTGIGFQWDFQIVIKNQLAYQFTETSFPPAQFTVKNMNSGAEWMKMFGDAGISTASVYDTMAATAFDNFSQKLIQHFGMKGN